MAVTNELNTMHGSSAWHATANHPGCGDVYQLATGTYGRDRMADYDLGCNVQLLRVHVLNSNRNCVGSNGPEGTKKCALRKFDIRSEEAGWGYIGRHEMPDPGSAVRRFS